MRRSPMEFATKKHLFTSTCLTRHLLCFDTSNKTSKPKQRKLCVMTSCAVKVNIHSIWWFYAACLLSVLPGYWVAFSAICLDFSIFCELRLFWRWLVSEHSNNGDKKAKSLITTINTNSIYQTLFIATRIQIWMWLVWCVCLYRNWCIDFHQRSNAYLSFCHPLILKCFLVRTNTNFLNLSQCVSFFKWA